MFNISKSAPKVWNLIKSVFASSILFSCSTNVDINKNISSSKTSEIETKLNNDLKPKVNDVIKPIIPSPNTTKDIDTVEKSNKDKDIIIGERKIIKSDNYFTIRDFKMFNGDRGLVLLESGEVLSISNNKLEKIDQLDGNNDGSICLNSKGNGLIFYVSGQAHLSESNRNKLYMNKIENYKITEKNIVIDNQIIFNQKPKCSIDENGNGLLVYPVYYIKKINSYKISNETMDFKSRGNSLIVDNDNVVNITLDDDKKYFSRTFNFSSKSVSENTKLDYNYLLPMGESQNNLSFLFQDDINKFELIKFKNVNDSEKINLNGNYNKYISSFNIDDNGNGLIVFYSFSSDDFRSPRNNMTLIKVKSYSLDVDSKIEFTDSNFLLGAISYPYSYISMIDNKGYVFWNDGNSTLNYSKIDIVDKK